MFNSFLGFLFKALPAGEVHAHGGAGSTRNKRRRARSGASGGGTTPKTDAKKQELVRKHSRLALQDGPAYRQQTSPTARRIVSNFQLQKQTTQKDYSKAIQSSIRKNTKKNWKKALTMTKKRGQV
jgi:hypothetical protein